jgi:hypothetical protein
MRIRSWAWSVAVALGLVLPTFPVLTGARVAFAAPAPRYRVGMRVKARRNCSVNGYQVKKGVVLNVAAVQTDDKGKVSTIDLSMSGMTISGVSAQVADSLFSPA